MTSQLCYFCLPLGDTAPQVALIGCERNLKFQISGVVVRVAKIAVSDFVKGLWVLTVASSALFLRQ